MQEVYLFNSAVTTLGAISVEMNQLSSTLFSMQPAIKKPLASQNTSLSTSKLQVIQPAMDSFHRSGNNLEGEFLKTLEPLSSALSTLQARTTLNNTEEAGKKAFRLLIQQHKIKSALSKALKSADGEDIVGKIMAALPLNQPEALEQWLAGFQKQLTSLHKQEIAKRNPTPPKKPIVAPSLGPNYDPNLPEYQTKIPTGRLNNRGAISGGYTHF